MSSIAEIVRPAEAGLRRVEEILQECLSAAHEEVRELERHSMKVKGKRIRPAVTLLAGSSGGELTEKNVNLAAAAELIHMATLVHDDVIDGASLRRGRSTINASWGNPVAVLFGDYLLSRAFAMLCRFRENGVLPAMAQMTHRVCEGEIFQLRRRFDTRMSEGDYRRMASMKTASLFSTCCRLSAALSGAARIVQEAMERFGELFGTAYQIADDCLDLVAAGGDKDNLKDIEGGRITLPLIKGLAMLTREERDRFTSSFREGDVDTCRRCMLSTDAVHESMRDAGRLMEGARRELDAVPDGPSRRALARLTEFVISRVSFGVRPVL